jgi:hypothetical protein
MVLRLAAVGLGYGGEVPTEGCVVASGAERESSALGGLVPSPLGKRKERGMNVAAT